MQAISTTPSDDALIEIYTGPSCSYCRSAKALLDRKQLAYREIDVSVPAQRAAMQRRLPGARTIPQIFVGRRHVGGYDDLERLEASGGLEALLREVIR